MSSHFSRYLCIRMNIFVIKKTLFLPQAKEKTMSHRLLHLDLSHNYIKKIRKHTLDPLYSLKTFNMSYNKLHRIEVFTFRMNIALVVINLSNNKLVAFDFSLRLLPELRMLNLLNSKISRLQAWQFEYYMRSANNSLYLHTFPYQHMCDDSWFFNGNAFVNITLEPKLIEYGNRFKIDYNQKCNLSMEHCSLKDIGSIVNKYCIPYETGSISLFIYLRNSLIIEIIVYSKILINQVDIACIANIGENKKDKIFDLFKRI